MQKTGGAVGTMRKKGGAVGAMQKKGGGFGAMPPTHYLSKPGGGGGIQGMGPPPPPRAKGNKIRKGCLIALIFMSFGGRLQQVAYQNKRRSRKKKVTR